MKRRDFMKTAGIAAGFIAMMGGLGMGTRRNAGIHALTSRIYPGRIVPVNRRRIAKIGRWAG